MADRSVRVILTADATQLVRSLKQASESADELHARINKGTQSTSAFEKVGTGAGMAGLTLAAGLGAAGKAAMDWESAWAGVRKTVDGSTEQMANLEGELRQMARTLPTTHADIAAVAEAAGQLGIKREDIAAFTKVMIDLGNTTNLTADEASTSLAQFMNIMGTSSANVQRLGSTIVALGNDGASTERQIVQMGQRIAAAGKSANMSETDVLAFASALSSVGVEAEAGGTAMSQTILQMGAAVREGGDDLRLMAKTAGMSSADFKKAWQTDAATAVQAFIVGLGSMQKTGKDANGVLDKLGMTGMRQADSIMRLANGNAILTGSLEVSAKGWKENSALLDEASKRYETTESKVKVAWNQIKDATISAGASMLPVVAQIATAAGVLADTFSSLPPGVQSTTVALGGVTSASLLAVGGVAKIATAASSAKEAFQAMGVAGKSATLAAGGIGAALAIAGGAYAMWADEQSKSKTRVDELADAIRGQTTAINSNSRAVVAKGLQDRGAFDAARALGISIEDVTEAAMGNEAALSRVNEAMKTRGHEAAIAIAEGRGYSVSIEDLSANQNLLAKSIGGSNAEIARAVEKNKQMAEAQGGVAEKAKALDLAIRQASVSVSVNGATLDTNTAQGKANEATLRQIAARAEELRMAQMKAGASSEEMTESTMQAREAFIRTAVQMGMTTAQAALFANEVNLIPREITTSISVKINDPDVGGMLARAQARINSNPLYVPSRGIVAAATGGYVSGPGSATSDSIPAMLSNGEYVLRAAAVRALGLERLDYLNATGRLPRFADGGSVGPTVYYSSAPARHVAPMGADAALSGADIRSAIRDGLAGAVWVMDGKVIDVRIKESQRALSFAGRPAG